MTTIDTTTGLSAEDDTIIVDEPVQDLPEPNTESSPDKISAYYSLAFPNFTYYLQTLTVTIGRRSVRVGSASSSETTPIDVDLGPLKSVSRLHAKIEYEEENERFVLVVLGRNGAWVDGIWSGSGSRVPLGPRSQIQIATRTFNFVLPPPPAPEDSPSPSSPSSTTRHLSPSIDVTSLSPASSLPPPSPGNDAPSHIIMEAPINKPNAKANGRKRKKPDPDHPKSLPSEMPPRPQYTYAQLCYRAIKALEGKATLQDICHWVAENFDWYRYNEGSGWENSIRHNLSSNRSFKKMDRCAGERGKGFFWSVDPKFEHTFEETEPKPGSSSSPVAKDGGKRKDGGGGKTKNAKGASVLDPPLKRSVKGESKTPLPPPLTSTPLPAFASTPAKNLTSATAETPPENSDPSSISRIQSATSTAQAMSGPTSSSTTGQNGTQTSNTSNPSLPSIPPDMIVPIVIGPMPSPKPTSSTADSSNSTAHGTSAHLSTPPIALRGDTIILNPTIFSSLTPEQLKELEALGARKAIDILQGYIVRFLKERIKNDGVRGRGKGRTKRGRSSAVKERGLPKDDASGAASSGAEGVTKADETKRGSDSTAPLSGSTTSKSKSKIDTSYGPFTTTPLPMRPFIPNGYYPQSAVASGVSTPTQSSTYQTFNNAVPSTVESKPPVPVRVFSPPPMAQLHPPTPTSPAQTVSQDTPTNDLQVGVDEPAFKKRRLETMEVGG